MSTHRAHVVLPSDLIEEIDAAVGPRGRSAFLVETARTELKRRRLLAVLRQDEPTWASRDHAELDGGAGEWVRGIRVEGERRTREIVRAE